MGRPDGKFARREQGSMKKQNKHKQSVAVATEKTKKTKEKIQRAISKMSIVQLQSFKQKMTTKLMKMCLDNPKYRDRMPEFMPELPVETHRTVGRENKTAQDSVQVVTYNEEGQKEEGLSMTELQEKEATERVKEQRRRLKDGLKALDKKEKKHKRRINKREKKTMPEEVPISRDLQPTVRLVVQNKGSKPRDPRFVGVNRELTDEARNWWNAFLSEKEKEEMKEINKEKRDAQGELKQELKAKKHQIKSHEFTLAREAERQKVRVDYKRKQIERMKEGKKPLYLTKKRETMLYTMEQYKKLKEIGKLDTYMQRKDRRKRNRSNKTES